MDASSSPTTASISGPVLTDHTVLQYLKSKGLGTAVLELTNHLKDKEGKTDSDIEVTTSSGTGLDPKDRIRQMRERLDEEESIVKNQRAPLTKVCERSQ